MIDRILFVLLALSVFASAVGVVYVKHESRKVFVQLQDLHKVRDELNVEWGRLQLEQSTFTTHGRIEEKAREKLGMKIPPPGAVVIVKP